MFFKQRQRLLREESWTADLLAQEMYAMFGPDVPLEHHGQITLVKPSNGSPIVLKDVVDGDTIISVPSREGAVEDEDAVSLDVVAGSAATAVGSGRPMAYQGTVLSGTHPTYSVRIYREGITADSEDVSVTQLSGKTGVAITAGAAAIVFEDVEGNYFMNIPVWG